MHDLIASAYICFPKSSRESLRFYGALYRNGDLIWLSPNHHNIAQAAVEDAQRRLAQRAKNAYSV